MTLSGAMSAADPGMHESYAIEPIGIVKPIDER